MVDARVLAVKLMMLLAREGIPPRDALGAVELLVKIIREDDDEG